jgi:hypothetical protein
MLRDSVTLQRTVIAALIDLPWFHDISTAIKG